MPKQTLKINSFEGGLNTDTDPRDLKDNEFADLKGVYVDKIGRIRTGGSIAQYNNPASTSALALSRGESTPTGYGFFQFSSDYDWEGVYSGNEIYTVLAIDEHLHINDDGTSFETTDEQGDATDDADTTASTLELGTTSLGGDVNNSFYYNNNALRCSETKNGTNADSKWIGYIDNTYFYSVYDASDDSIGVDNDYRKKGWFIVDQYLSPPTEVFMSNQSGTQDITDANHWDEIDAANLISIGYQEASGTLDNISDALKDTTWLFGISYIYDGTFNDNKNSNMAGVNSQYTQESTIEILKYNHSSEQYQTIDFSGYTRAAIIQPHFKAGSAYNDQTNSQSIGMNPRVTGMRFYIKEYEGEGFQHYDKRNPVKPWLRVAEVDLCTGVYTNFAYTSGNSFTLRRMSSVNDDRGNTWNGSSGNGAEFMALGSGGSAENNTTDNGILISTLPSESYYSLNGYHHYNLINCKYGTATVINHSAYIANIYDVTNSVYYGDRVIRTPKFKLDTFSTDFFVDIVPGDGDTIIKLETFADRLLVYKTRKLFVINVSQESMYIEQELNGLGVVFPSQVIRTDFGVAWCNSSGVYMFDGQKISNLSDNIIKTTWDSFYTETGTGASVTTSVDFTQIGYDPKSKHLILLKSNNAGNGDCLVFDMKIKSWIYLDSLYTDNTDKTNFFISPDNKLLLHLQDGSNNHIKKYSDTSGNVASGSLVIQTKDFDFGNPQQKKTIYKVYITYKTGGATNVQVKFDTNGGTAFTKQFKDGTNFTSDELDDAGGGDWVRAELVPDTMSETKNIYSFALKFTNNGIVPATFQINDISIVYRQKGIR